MNRRTGMPCSSGTAPCLRERHPVLGAVVGHITDLEAIAGRRVKGSSRLSM
jgi:hypothetical protein